jgi:hypothetical protein
MTWRHAESGLDSEPLDLLAGLGERPDQWTDEQWQAHLVARADQVPAIEPATCDRSGRGISRVELREGVL